MKKNGSKHLLVCILNSVKTARALLIRTQYDFSSAFDCQDPTKTLKQNQFDGNKIFPYPSSDIFFVRKIHETKIQWKTSRAWKLKGGSPQGSFLEQICYTTGSHDNTEQLNIDK